MKPSFAPSTVLTKTYITLPFSLPSTAAGMPRMTKAVSYLHIFLFVGHSEAATSHISRNNNEDKSYLSFFFPEILTLTVRVSGTGLILHKAQPLTTVLSPSTASESSHTHFHWLSLYFHITFSFLRWLFLLKCTPCGKTATWDAIAQH